MSEAQTNLPTIREVEARIGVAPESWNCVPAELIRVIAAMCEEKRQAALTEHVLDENPDALWVSEQHGSYVAEPGYVTPDSSAYKSWRLYVPVDTVAPVLLLASVSACERVLQRIVDIAVKPAGWSAVEHQHSLAVVAKDAGAVVDALKARADTPVFIAHLTHSPDDVAIGVGLSDEAAIDGLLAAYPGGLGKTVEVSACTLGTGVASLAEAPVVACRIG